MLGCHGGAATCPRATSGRGRRGRRTRAGRRATPPQVGRHVAGGRERAVVVHADRDVVVTAHGRSTARSAAAASGGRSAAPSRWGTCTPTSCLQSRGAPSSSCARREERALEAGVVDVVDLPRVAAQRRVVDVEGERVGRAGGRLGVRLSSVRFPRYWSGNGQKSAECGVRHQIRRRRATRADAVDGRAEVRGVLVRLVVVWVAEEDGRQPRDVRGVRLPAVERVEDERRQQRRRAVVVEWQSPVRIASSLASRFAVSSSFSSKGPTEKVPSRTRGRAAAAARLQLTPRRRPARRPRRRPPPARVAVRVAQRDRAVPVPRRPSRRRRGSRGIPTRPSRRTAPRRRAAAPPPPPPRRPPPPPPRRRYRRRRRRRCRPSTPPPPAVAAARPPPLPPPRPRRRPAVEPPAASAASSAARTGPSSCSSPRARLAGRPSARCG